MGRRNAHALAALRLKAGPHSARRRPDPVDPTLEDDTDAHVRDWNVGDDVRILIAGPYYDYVGRVMSLDYNLDGRAVWTVDFEDGSPFVPFNTQELERIF